MDAQVGAGSDDTADAQGWATTLEAATGAYPGAHFILSAGDQVDSAANEAQYSGFLAPGALTTYPLITNIGNHDYKSLAYRQHFNMPNIDETSVSASESASNYSSGNYWFVYNETLYISFNSNNTDNDGHVAYMRRVIAEHGDAARWIVVHFHHSVFSVANHATDSDIIVRRQVLPPAFTELGVDVVLMGHDHCYTRSYLMNGATSDVRRDHPRQR